MIERNRREASVKALRRMIAYLREEALRLRVMDVALLLEQAEGAVTAFAPAPLGGHGLASTTLDASRGEH